MNEESDVFVRDLVAGTTSLVSAGGGGDSAVAGFRRGVFAGDGQVLFESLACDTNASWDIYLAGPYTPPPPPPPPPSTTTTRPPPTTTTSTTTATTTTEPPPGG